MPRLCHETIYSKLSTMKYLNFLAEPGEQACEVVANKLDFLGIWGEYDPDAIPEYIPWTDLNWWKEFLMSLWAPDKIYFKLIIHVIIGISCFLLGLLYRWNKIRELNNLIEEHKNKSSILSQQLFSIMQEKLEIKKEKEELKMENAEVTRDLSLIEGEKENLKNKAWGLERNISILQDDRSVLEGKIRDLLNASKMTMDRTDASRVVNGNMTTQEELRDCKRKMLQLQTLVKSLIEHTKHREAINLSAMQNSSHV